MQVTPRPIGQTFGIVGHLPSKFYNIANFELVFLAIDFMSIHSIYSSRVYNISLFVRIYRMI